MSQQVTYLLTRVRVKSRCVPSSNCSMCLDRPMAFWTKCQKSQYHEGYCLLGYVASHSVCRRNISPPSSGSKNKLSMKPESRLQAELVSCLVYSSTLKMEAMFLRNFVWLSTLCSKMSENIVLFKTHDVRTSNPTQPISWQDSNSASTEY
jgi:hypothetical protein